MIAYPDVLKPATWDAKKGTLAKLAGETGVGAALTELMAAYGAIDQAMLTAGGYGKLHDDAEVDAALVKAKSYYASSVEPVRAKCIKVRDLANKTAAKFTANKLIPKSSTDAATNVAKGAELLMVGLKSLDAEFATFGAAKAKLAAQVELLKKSMMGHLSNLDAGAKACLAAPTAANWVAKVRQQNRSVANGLKVVPEWNKAFWGVWVKLDGHQISDSETDVAKIKAACTTLIAETAKVKSGIA